MLAWDLMWKPNLEKAKSPLLILSSSNSENFWTIQRNVIGIQHPNQCDWLPACRSCSAGLHAPRPRQCAALLTEQYKDHLSRYVDSHYTDKAAFIMGIPMLLRWHLYIEMVPRLWIIPRMLLGIYEQIFVSCLPLSSCQVGCVYRNTSQGY